MTFAGSPNVSKAISFLNRAAKASAWAVVFSFRRRQGSPPAHHFGFSSSFFHVRPYLSSAHLNRCWVSPERPASSTSKGASSGDRLGGCVREPSDGSAAGRGRQLAQ